MLPDEALKNRLVNVSGYPFEPGEGKAQYFHANRVKALTGRRLFYDIDTMGGQSGSPVWAYEEGSDVPVVVAIHAYGVGGVPNGLNVVANSGPRVLPEVLEVIRGWIARGNTEAAAAGRHGGSRSGRGRRNGLNHTHARAGTETRAGDRCRWASGRGRLRLGDLGHRADARHRAQDG